MEQRQKPIVFRYIIQKYIDRRVKNDYNDGAMQRKTMGMRMMDTKKVDIRKGRAGE